MYRVNFPVIVFVFDWSYIANEWWDRAGVAMTLSKVIPMTSVIMQFLLTTSSLVVRVCPASLRRFLPSFFEMLFPVLCPRPAKVIDKTRIAWNELGRLAVRPIHDRALDSTFDKCKSRFGIVEAGSKLPRSDCVQRASEGLGLIEGRFHCEPFSVAT